MEVVKQRYSVDMAKVYLGGHSMGGGGDLEDRPGVPGQIRGLYPDCARRK